MGIAVRELLTLEYFKDFYVVAGRRGLHKEIQGVTLLEAPDALHWARGKELILSSGYVIRQAPNCIQDAFREGSMQKISAMMIKRGRYLNSIEENLIELFDKHDIPLISMPFSVPWMELMSQINTAVMNRTIRRFHIRSNPMWQVSDQSYKVQKIRRILQAVEVEMKFPAFLYDLAEEEGYYSSPNFKIIMESFGLTESDYWNPSRPFTKYTLCDYIHMARIRLIDQDDNMGTPRVSWIIIPISMEGITQAYFVVMESREFIDYYDEYAIRIAYLTLQGVYEQIMVAQSMGNVGFNNFIHFALNYNETEAKKFFYQAGIQGISLNTLYTYTVFRQCNEKYSARSAWNTFTKAFKKSRIDRIGRMALLDENEGIILIEAEKLDENMRKNNADYRMIQEFSGHVSEMCGGMQLEFGLCREEKPLSEIKECVRKCQRVLKMGKIIFPNQNIWEYSMLGPLTWLQVPEDEMDALLKDYRKLTQDEKNIELLKTLKIYLENNMNYSITAEKMYVHINTIRKRIDKVNDLLDIEWDSHISRLKAELLLKFLGL